MSLKSLGGPGLTWKLGPKMAAVISRQTRGHQQAADVESNWCSLCRTRRKKILFDMIIHPPTPPTKKNPKKPSPDSKSSHLCVVTTRLGAELRRADRRRTGRRRRVRVEAGGEACAAAAGTGAAAPLSSPSREGRDGSRCGGS